MLMDSLLCVFTLDCCKGYLLYAALSLIFLMHFISENKLRVTWNLVILYGKYNCLVFWLDPNLD